MKRFLLLILTLALVFALVLSVSSCDVVGGKSQNGDSANTPGDNETPDNSAHTHSYTVKNTDAKYLKSAASCTKSAEYFYSCECGEKSTNTFTHGNFASHNYEGGKCTVCDASDPNYVNPNAPVAGKTYHLGLVNTNVDTDVHYICGGMVATYYLATSTDESDALDVYVEKITDGYYIYTLSGSDKNYINFIVDGSYVNAKYQPTPSTVFTYSDSLDTLTAVVNGEDYLLGVPNTSTYVNAGPYKASTNPFYCTFYEVSEGGNTENPPHTHNFVDGECTVCGADDPDYIPTHTHNFVDGECTVCGADDPDYIPPHTHNFVDGECTVCGADDPDYIPPHTHNFVDGECTVCGADYYSEGLAYKLSGDGTYYIVTGIGAFEGTTLAIPEEHEGLPVMEIKESAFEGNSTIVSVKIPKTIKYVKDRAFANCSGVEKIYYDAANAELSHSNGIFMWMNSGKNSGVDVIIGSNVSFLPGMFLDFNKIKSVKFEANSNKLVVDNGVFQGCTGIKDIYIPSLEWWLTVSFGTAYSNPMYYTQNVYVNGQLMTEFALPSGITEIGRHVFAGCPLDSVVIPEGITSIGTGAFRHAKMTSLSLPDSLQKIGYYAFYDCATLERLSIPENVTEIKNYAFDYCTGLTKLYINAKNLADIYQDSSEYNEASTIPTWHFRNIGTAGDGIELTIGNKVTAVKRWLFDNNSAKIVSLKFEDGSTCRSIDDYAFDQLEELVSVELPDSLKYIGVSAFRLAGFSSIVIPGSVTEIGYGAFESCANLIDLSIGSGVETIGGSAFKHCTSLTHVTIPGNVDRIESDTFEGCTNLVSITIPSSVTHIAYDAFKDCANFTDIYYVGSEDDWGAIVISGHSEAISNATIHYNCAP